MLDIHGQPGPAVQPAGAAAPALAHASGIPGVSGASSRLTQLVALLGALLVLAAGGYLSYERATTQALVDARTREVTELKRSLAEPATVTLATTVDALTAGSAALQSVSATADWSTFLDVLSKRTVSGAVLENVSVDEQWSVRLSGSARSYADVAAELTALQSSDRFSAVELESSALNEGTRGTRVTFSIKATFVPAQAGASAESPATDSSGDDRTKASSTIVPEPPRGQETHGA